VTGRALAGRIVVAAFAAYGVLLAVAGRGGPLPASRPGAVSPGASDASGRTAGEDEVVASLAASGLRAATDEDATDSESRDEFRSLYVEYHPFFVRGDFDSDGRLDFAQAFVRRDGPEPLFDVAVFFGTVSGFSPPVWVERGLQLSTGDLSADRSVLVVTEDVEQDVSRRWRWDRSAARFVDVDGTEGGEPWTDPDGRAGTTA
jgi:hypothetical protein